MNSLLRHGRILLLVALALAVILPSTAVAQLSEHNDLQGERPSVKPREGDEAVPGEIIVKFKENAGQAARANVRRAEGLEKKNDLDIIDAEVDKVNGQSAEEAIRALESRPDVEYAEPNFIYHATGFENSPDYSKLWGLHNTGQTGGTPDVDVNGKEASIVTKGNPSHVIAVIDTGVDFSHPDLIDRAWKNPGESGSGKETNGIDDDGNGIVDDVNGADFVNDDGDPYDDHFHGTHVSGTIAASVNGQGVVGVAPNVKIMAVKFLDANGFGSLEDAILAIEYAKSKGVKISNNSWGCYCFSQALKDAIDASDSLFVAAAGNNDNNNDINPFYPASYDDPNILSVAAIDHQGNKAWFSNYGATTVDIAAPGVDIYSSLPVPRDKPAAALSSVGSSGKAVTTGFGAEEISDATKRASFFTKAFTAVNRGSQSVALVDDDGSSNGFNPDVGPSLSAAIQSATGSAPQVINVPDGANGPDLSQLSGKTVVWATGEDFGCADPALNPTDQTTLTSFLNGGGKLVLTGMDALYCIETSPFATSTLQLNVQSDIGPSTTFQGSSGTAFAGESYSLSSTTFFHDDLSPASSAAVTQGVYPAGSAPTHGYLSGTSMASPHVAGVAGLVASSNPSLLNNPVALKSQIMKRGKLSIMPGQTVTGKMADAHAALLPQVKNTTPVANKEGVAAGTNVNATFSLPMKSTTVTTSTFYLVRKGTTTKIPATVSYNAITKQATLDPSSNLLPGKTYVATVRGGSTGVKDTQGDAMGTNKVWQFTVAP